MSFNRVMLIGRRTPSSTFRWSGDGKYARAESSLRTQRPYKDKDGKERMEVTDVPLVAFAFSGLAEVIRDMPDDKDVSIEGRLRLEELKDSGGKKTSHYFVQVERCDYEGAKQPEPSSRAGPPQASRSDGPPGDARRAPAQQRSLAASAA